MFSKTIHPVIRLLLVLATGLLIGLLLGWRSGRTVQPDRSAEMPPASEKAVRPEPVGAYAKLVDWPPSDPGNASAAEETGSTNAEEVRGQEHYQTSVWGGFSVNPL